MNVNYFSIHIKRREKYDKDWMKCWGCPWIIYLFLSGHILTYKIFKFGFEILAENSLKNPKKSHNIWTVLQKSRKIQLEYSFDVHIINGLWKFVKLLRRDKELLKFKGFWNLLWPFLGWSLNFQYFQWIYLNNVVLGQKF
jgi:hypothetical protein